jgi:hypothetical protein
VNKVARLPGENRARLHQWRLDHARSLYVEFANIQRRELIADLG